MSETRTGPLVGKLVVAVQEDLAEVVGYLQKAREGIGQLEGQTRGISGLSSFLKAQGIAIDKMVADLGDEATDVEKKMLGARVEITHNVDEGHAAKGGGAKEAA